MEEQKFNIQDYFGKIKNILIKNARFAVNSSGQEGPADILIENNLLKNVSGNIKISEIPGSGELIYSSERIKMYPDHMVIDAGGLIAATAFTDIHTHLREPGNEQEEDISSARSAAYAGGITSVFGMPNTNPCIDCEHLVRYIRLRAIQEEFDVFCVAAMTRNLEGLEMTETGLLKKAGAIALSDDGKCVQDAKLMYEIMKYSKQFDMPLILHEEDYSFSRSGFVHEGFYSAKLGLDGILPLSEEVIITRDILLALRSGAKVHFTHLSSAASVELVRKAKEDGANVTCDVTPHHIFFNDSCLESFNPNFKVNPPIRSEEDRRSLIDGLNSGVIDAIASDHAPHLAVEKNSSVFSQAPYGATGMETLFKASYTALCKKEGFSVKKLISLLSRNPRKIFNLDNPEIENPNKGKKIDMVLINLDSKKKIDKEDFYSKSSNSPFLNEELYSDIFCTIRKGKLVYLSQDGE
jgi:dihydroorotase